MKQYTDFDMGGSARVTNLPAPQNPNDAARLADLNNAIEGLAWKDEVRVRTATNVNLAAPGATVDGVTMVAGQSFLAPNQSAPAENGIYVWNAAGTSATRRPDANVFKELEGAVVTVTEGTSANTTYRQTQIGGTIDVSTNTWTLFGTSSPPASETTAGISRAATQAEVDAGTSGMYFVRPETLLAFAGRVRKAQLNIGNASATQFTFTHNFNTRDVQIQVVRSTSPYDTVQCDQERDTVNSVVLRFIDAPSLNQFRVVLLA